jgi:acetyl esterase/lipase
MKVPAGVRTTPTTIADRPGLRVEPERDARPGTILYFHGGGWVFGSPQTALCLTANLVVRTGFSFFSLDYRLAPEHPFAGDSAGGGLCVTTCLKARAAGLPMPAAIVAFSPGLDATRSGASMGSNAGIDPVFTLEGLGPTSAMYLAGQDPTQELLSPAILADLRGFPPLLLQVGTNELLLDDSTRLAERARAAQRRCDPRRHRGRSARLPGVRRPARGSRSGFGSSGAFPEATPRRKVSKWWERRSVALGRGIHYCQEDHPDKIGNAIAAWITSLT